jgi:phage replication O-like protein O
MRIPAPNHTQTPNDLFDHWLPHLNESELKVLLVIIRKTFGWHRVHDIISLSQLQHFTGLSETSVLGAIKSLIQKGVIRKEVVGPSGKQQSHYSLVVEESNNSYPPSKCGGPPQQVGKTPPVSGDTKENHQKKGVDDDERAHPRKENELPDIPYTKQTLFADATRHRKDWTNQEIEFAWSKIMTYPNPITDYVRFTEAVIKNERIRIQNYNAQQKQKEKQCTQQKVKKQETTESKPQSKAASNTISEQDTSEHPLADWRSIKTIVPEFMRS